MVNVVAALQQEEHLLSSAEPRAAPRVASTPLRLPRKPAWADASPSDDSSVEGDEHGGEPPPLLGDDSYQEGPTALLEDSRDGLSGDLRRGASLGSRAPVDFNFLVSPSGGVKWEDEANSLSSPPESIGYRIGSAWQPNVEAQEFIPTASMDCVRLPPQATVSSEPTLTTPVGSDGSRADAVPPDSRRQGAPRRRRGAARAADSMLERDLNKDLTTPEKTFPGGAAGPLGEGRRQRQVVARKRRPPTLQVPLQKRTKSEERETPAGAERRQRAVRARAKAQAPEPVAAPAAAPSALPDASEEWQHRIAMRRKAVAVGKDTAEYKWYTQAKLGGECEGGGLQTPDPTDRNISKRYWKYTLQKWRIALKQLYLESNAGGLATDANVS